MWSYLHAGKQVLVEVVGEENVVDGDFLAFPVLQFLVEGAHLCLQLEELRQAVEAVEFQFE